MTRTWLSWWQGLVSVGVASLLLAGCVSLPLKSKAGLQVVTPDGTASLFLDGAYLDKTPYINKEIKPGTYTLRIQPDDPNLVPHETTITLHQGTLGVVVWKAGTRPELSSGVIYEMEKLSSSSVAELSLVSIPDAAIVSLDQRAKAFSPLSVSDIEAGQHEFEVSLPSYETQKHTVNVVAGHRVQITLKLAKQPLEGDESNTQTTPTATPSATPSSKPTTATGSATKTAPSSAVRPSTITGPRVLIKSTGLVVDGKEGARIRETAATSAKQVGMALTGEQYALVSETAGWFEISFPGGKGWVSSSLATKQP
jgi:hypothetical protein